MATLAEIAKKVGVTPAVVSRVLNKDKTLRVSTETRAKVEEAARAMNYSPNVAAQSLRSSKSGVIAFVLHDIANPVYAEILRGAQAEAVRQQKAILLGDASVGAESNTRLAQMVGGGGVDGLILQAAGASSDELIARAAQQKIPIVLLQADIGIDAHLITLPDFEAASIATRHLLELGHQRVGCIATAKNLTFTAARLAGWRAALGSDADETLVTHCDPNSAAGEIAARSILSDHPDLTGLVCFNVVAAIGAMRAIHSLGLQVPQDISVITVHDVKFAQDLRVPLTVVSMPLFEMGEVAIRSICNPKLRNSAQSELSAQPQLVVRESTARPRSN